MFTTKSQVSTVNFNILVCSQGLHLKISWVGRDRQDAHGVGVAKTSLPALHSDDGGSCLDDVQRKRVLQAEPDTVVNLDKIYQFQLKTNQTRAHAYIFLPLTLSNSTRLRVPEWITSTVEMDLARGLLVPSDLKRSLS
jgi:hypothetical protein